MAATASQGLRSVLAVARYRGRFGHLDWILHRVSGLGVLLFLLLHIIDTSTVHFAPSAYNVFLVIYKNPVFGLLEIVLGACLVYHSLNGLRIVVMDFWPQLWQKQPQARRLVWAGFFLLFVPMGAIQLVNIIRHLNG